MTDNGENGLAIDGVGDLSTIRVSELSTAGHCLRRLAYRRFVQLGGSRLAATLELRRVGAAVCAVDDTGIVVAPSAAMIGGSAVDAALNEHHAQRIAGVNGLRGTALTDYAVTTHRRLLEEATGRGPLSGEPDEAIEKDMVGVLPIYEEEIDPITEPMAVQRTESKTYDGGVTLVGHIDLIAATAVDNLVVDHKFTKKAPSQMPASTSLQLRGYSELTGMNHVELILLRRLKTPVVETTSHNVTPTERVGVLHTLRRVAWALSHRFFPMAEPSSWVCSPQWCGYWSVCRGREGGPLPIPGEVEG